MLKKIAAGGVAVALGFLLVTNPVVADAAKQITGKQIKNDSVTGKDIKESSLKNVNASTLNGRPSSSFLNQSYRFRLPAGSPATIRTFSFPGLPAGRYLVTYQTAILGGAGIFCALSADKTSFTAAGEAVSFSAVQGGSFTNAGSTVLAVAAGKTAGLQCSSSAAFSVYGGPDAMSSVTFTRVDTLTERGVSAVARPARAASGNAFAH